MRAKVEITAANVKGEIQTSIEMKMQIDVKSCLEMNQQVCGFIKRVLSNENVMNFFGLHACDGMYIEHCGVTSDNGNYELKAQVGKNRMPIGGLPHLRSEEEIRATDAVLSIKVQHMHDE